VQSSLVLSNLKYKGGLLELRLSSSLREKLATKRHWSARIVGVGNTEFMQIRSFVRYRAFVSSIASHGLAKSSSHSEDFIRASMRN
jgi:hypothetical protein